MKKLFFSLTLLCPTIIAFSQSVPVSGDQYHLYGPNSTWGQYLKVGGNGRGTTNASVVATNGNLHLDSKDGYALYLNHYSLSKTLLNTQGGNVGIGTSSPDYKLDINGSVRLGIDNNSGLLLSRFTSGLTDVPGSTSGMLFSGPIHAHMVFDIYGNDPNDGFYVRIPSILQTDPTVDKTAFVVKANARIGIGTSVVDDKLHLKQEGGDAVFKIENTGNGNASIIKFSRERQTGEDVTGGAIGIVSNTSTNWSQLFLNARSGDAHIGVDGSGGQIPFLTIGDGVSNTLAIGIGTTTPRNALDVAGTIRSTEVKVEATPWPDFVFAAGYKLTPLEEVETFIAANNHLPEMPNEAEVIENGINLGEMDAKLLQKIEELTLYLIEQNRKIEQLQNEINQLQQK